MPFMLSCIVRGRRRSLKLEVDMNELGIYKRGEGEEGHTVLL